MTGGHVLIQATVKIEAGFPFPAPYSISLFSNMPTRHGSAAGQKEEGARGVEGLRDGGGGLEISGAGEGVGINPSDVDS